MTDDLVFSSNRPAHVLSNSLDQRGEELGRFVPVWSGAMHEFRNHLTVLLATATEMRTAISPAMAMDIAEAVTETERNVQNLNSLIAQIDAIVKTGEPLISDLDEVVDRALRIAAPALGRRITVSVSKGRKAGVRNRGAALESLLSALVVDLARAAEGRPTDGSRRPHIQIHVDVGRSAVVIEIESNGARPAPGSWRGALATELAAKLDATIAAHPDVAGFVIQFR